MSSRVFNSSGVNRGRLMNFTSFDRIKDFFHSMILNVVFTYYSPFVSKAIHWIGKELKGEGT